MIWHATSAVPCGRIVDRGFGLEQLVGPFGKCDTAHRRYFYLATSTNKLLLTAAVQNRDGKITYVQLRRFLGRILAATPGGGHSWDPPCLHDAPVQGSRVLRLRPETES